MRWALVLLLAGCGRIGFDPATTGDGGTGDGDPADAVDALRGAAPTRSQCNYTAVTSSPTMLETTLGSPVLASEVIFVAIGWNDAISVVTTVTDTTGDTFTPAQAVQRGGAMSQQVYLALTPQGGANKIAVVFSQAVPNPSVRVCIYAGVKQTDLPATVGAGGNGTFAVSGTVTTVVPNELVIASVVGTSNAGLDLAFVTAINTTPLGHVVEEHVAPMPRNMQASASFGPTSDWVIVLSSLQPF